jgi:hypothetical protein
MNISVHQHIVVLITDGQSNNKDKTVAQAERMHANGVEVTYYHCAYHATALFLAKSMRTITSSKH